MVDYVALFKHWNEYRDDINAWHIYSITEIFGGFCIDFKNFTVCTVWSMLFDHTFYVCMTLSLGVEYPEVRS